MLLLAGTSAVLKVITGQAVTVDTHASFVDSDGTPGTENHNISTAVTTTVVAAPASGKQRNVEELWITNKSASSTCDVTVQHTDGTTTVQIGGLVTLAAGESIQIDKYGKVHRLNAKLAKVVSNSAPGQLVKTTTFTAGTTMNLGSSTNSIRCRLVGGGAGGGGCTSVASAAGGAGGGGAGGYAEKLFSVSPGAAVAFVIGGAGAGNSGAGGGNGGDTTVTVGVTTVTAKGGTGAAAVTSSAAVTASAGGSGGVVGSNGDVNAPGMDGDVGLVTLVATPVGKGGQGGGGPFGDGGKAIVAAGAGSAATGNGSGGGGGLTGASAARAGGAGTVGMLIIDEYT